MYASPPLLHISACLVAHVGQGKVVLLTATSACLKVSCELAQFAERGAGVGVAVALADLRVRGVVQLAVEHKVAAV